MPLPLGVLGANVRTGTSDPKSVPCAFRPFSCCHAYDCRLHAARGPDANIAAPDQSGPPVDLPKAGWDLQSTDEAGLPSSPEAGIVAFRLFCAAGQPAAGQCAFVQGVAARSGFLRKQR